MIQFILDLCSGILLLGAFIFAIESTKLVEEKKKRQKERNNER